MNLSELRTEIDLIDREILSLLEKRLDVSADIAAYKKENKKAVLDSARELQKLASIRSMSRSETADEIVSVFEAVIASSRSYQHKLLGDRDDE